MFPMNSPFARPDGALVGRRALLGLAGALLVRRAAWPDAVPGAAEGKAAIRALYDALRASMKMGKSATFNARFDKIAPVIDRVFDLDTILRASVGLRWSGLDEATRKTLFTAFRTFTIATYAANFDEDGGERFEVLAETRPTGTDIVIGSKLTPGKGDPVRIDYVMRKEDAGWRAVDVLLDGSISRVAVQRSDFRALLGSGDAGPLIDSLKKKIVELSGGAIHP